MTLDRSDVDPRVLVATTGSRVDDEEERATAFTALYRRELDEDRRRCTPGLRFYQRLMDTDRDQRFANQGRLRDLKRDHGRQITIFCSHDEKELEAMQRGEPLPSQGGPTRDPRFAESIA